MKLAAYLQENAILLLSRGAFAAFSKQNGKYPTNARGGNRYTWNWLSHNFDYVLKNLYSGKIPYMWQIERVQIDAIKFQRTEINFFSDVFTSAVVIVTQAP